MAERLERHTPTFGERDTSHIMDIAHERSLAIVQGIEQAYSALRAANGDFERLVVRDQARAAVAAAAILKRRDIQTEASVLVATAEREIAKANPPTPPEERSPGRGGNTVNPDNDIPDAVSGEVVRQIRQAHGSLTDEQFQALTEQAREKGEPLTREVLKREAKKLNPPEPKGDPDKPKLPTKAERLDAERDVLALDVQDKATRIEEMEDELQFHRGNMDEQETERHKAFTAVRAELSTALSQNNEWMTKANDEVQARKGMTYDRDRWRERAMHPCANCGTEAEWADG